MYVSDILGDREGIDGIFVRPIGVSFLSVFFARETHREPLQELLRVAVGVID